MRLYRNISGQELTVNGFLVKAGDIIKAEIIENANFEEVKSEKKSIKEPKVIEEKEKQ